MTFKGGGGGSHIIIKINENLSEIFFQNNFLLSIKMLSLERWMKMIFEAFYLKRIDTVFK